MGLACGLTSQQFTTNQSDEVRTQHTDLLRDINADLTVDTAFITGIEDDDRVAECDART